MPEHPGVTVRAARELYAAGVSMAEIARRLGVGRSTVYRWLYPSYAERVRMSNRRGDQLRRKAAGHGR
jgi:transposase